MPAWSTDARHLPPERDKTIPAPARRRADFTRALIEAATSRLGDPRWRTSVRCIAHECSAPIEVLYDGADSITWSCTGCSDEGVITGFVGSEHDLSVFVTLGDEITWTIDEQQLELLRAATVSLPELRGTIVRAEPYREGLIVRATHEELQNLYNLVDHLERSSGKLEQFAGLARTLSAALNDASRD